MQHEPYASELVLNKGSVKAAVLVNIKAITVLRLAVDIAAMLHNYVLLIFSKCSDVDYVIVWQVVGLQTDRAK